MDAASLRLLHGEYAQRRQKHLRLPLLQRMRLPRQKPGRLAMARAVRKFVNPMHALAQDNRLDVYRLLVQARREAFRRGRSPRP
jgi:hypothetical protein